MKLLMGIVIGVVMFVAGVIVGCAKKDVIISGVAKAKSEIDARIKK